MLKKLALTGLLAAGVACAQEWEVGAIGGYGYAPHLTVSNKSSSANTGIRHGAVVGVFAGEDMYDYWSGEIRYLYRFGNLKLSSGNIKAANFSAHTHIITADFLGHFRPRGSSVRPFIAFGGGAKIMVGTGIESASQLLAVSPRSLPRMRFCQRPILAQASNGTFAKTFASASKPAITSVPCRIR
jgi:hypothetical protein